MPRFDNRSVYAYTPTPQPGKLPHKPGIPTQPGQPNRAILYPAQQGSRLRERARDRAGQAVQAGRVRHTR